MSGEFESRETETASTYQEVTVTKANIYGVKLSNAASFADMNEARLSFSISNGDMVLSSDSDSFDPNCVSVQREYWYFTNHDITREGARVLIEIANGDYLFDSAEYRAVKQTTDDFISSLYINFDQLDDFDRFRGYTTSENPDCRDSSCMAFNRIIERLGSEGFRFNGTAPGENLTGTVMGELRVNP